MFFEMVKETCQTCFKQSMDQLLGHLSHSGHVNDDDLRSLMFGDYMFPDADPRVYDEVTDLPQLTSTMEQCVVFRRV